MWHYQLQRALTKYQFTNSHCNAWDQPSPATAIPPLATIPLAVLRSAYGPVEMEFDSLWIGWPGKADSAIPSWPDGIKSNGRDETTRAVVREKTNHIRHGRAEGRRPRCLTQTWMGLSWDEPGRAEEWLRMNNGCWTCKMTLEEGPHGYLSLYIGKEHWVAYLSRKAREYFSTQQFIAGIIQKKPLNITDPVKINL